MHHKRLKAATLIYPLLGMVLTLISMSPAQAQSELTEQLKALVEAGQAEQAYELATDALFNNEGKPGFDYYYGVAAIDAGKVDEGIFALERLLVANPDNHRVRLELARGYYLLGQYERAKSEFNTVLAIDPPQQVRENVVRYLDAIDQRESAYKTKLSGFVQLSTGWDGNVNSAPGDPSFTTPTLGSGTLGAGSVSDGDRFMSLTGGASISHPLTQQWSLLGNVQRSDLILEKNRDFETTAMDVGGSAVWQSGDYSARLNLGFQDYSLGHERYRDASSIGVELATMLNKTSRLSVFTQGSDLSYPGQPTRNSQLSNLGTGLLLAPAVSFSPVISLSAYLGSERPHMDTNAARASTDRDIRGVNASVNTSLTDKTSLTLSSQWQTSEYRDTNAIFLVKRDDTYKSLGLSLGYQYNNDFSLSAGWDYSETNSNISINAYHRNRFSLTARYDF